MIDPRVLPLPPAAPEDVVVEAQHRIRQGIEVGVGCPCCGQLCKVYHRHLNATRCLGLLWLERFTTEHPESDGWVHVGDSAPRHVVKSGGEFAKLRWWLLIEALPNEDPRRKASGVWRITDRGKQFVAGEIRLPRTIYLFNNCYVGYSEDTINISQGLEEGFDYSELMNKPLDQWRDEP